MDADCFVADLTLHKGVREHIGCNTAVSLLPHMPGHDWHMDSRHGRQMQPYYGSV